MKWSGGIFPSSRFYLASVISATWVDSSTPLCCGRNDIPEGITFYPHRLYLQRGRRHNSHPYMHVGTSYQSFLRVVFVTLLGDESSPLHCVVPFIHTSYIRNVPGTAHRPFPTVSLMGIFLNRRISKTGTSVAPKIVNCPLSIVNF